MNATKVKQVMPQIFSILRTNPIMMRFSRRQVYILTRIIFISLLHSTSAKSHAVYCVASEKYLANAVDCTRETVSRNIRLLKEFKFLDVTNRRKVDGRWSTNLYKIGTLLWSLIQDVTTRFFSIVNRVTSASHIVTENRNISHTKNIGTRNSIKIKDPPEKKSFLDFFERHPELA